MMTLPAVFVLNTSDDVVEMLRVALEKAGFAVATGFIDDLQRGRLDLPQQLELHRPSVILFDISMPYERRWNVLQQLRTNPIAAGIRFVLTSSNVRRLRQAVSTDEPVLEIAGEDDDLASIVAAVRSAASAA
jgi:CheY-like chemotaxis protein